MNQFLNKEEYTHKVDLEFCGELYKDVIREHKKTQQMLNYDNSENGSSCYKDFDMNLSKDSQDDDENKTDLQHLEKDTMRSTWWMADETKNKKMKQWVKNLQFKDELHRIEKVK